MTWGWFQGGFAPTTPAGNGTTYAVCGATPHERRRRVRGRLQPAPQPVRVLRVHVATRTTSRPRTSTEVGHNGQANHQYDLTWFDKAVKRDDLPAVSFVKAAEYQDGHAGYSDPIDEQHFLVDEINMLQKSPEWKSTAVVVAYDDSDGWYDHVASTIENGSTDRPGRPRACASRTPGGRLATRAAAARARACRCW